MTTEPTDEDVERLARLMRPDCAPDEIGTIARRQAREALRSGEVTLAPKPEPEPPKRYKAESWGRAGNHWNVSDPANRKTLAVFYEECPDAQQRAEALCAELNGERSSYLVDYDVNLAQWRKRAEEAEQAFIDAATERDMLQARNRELERELAEAARPGDPSPGRFYVVAEEDGEQLVLRSTPDDRTFGLIYARATEHAPSGFMRVVANMLNGDPESLAQVRSDEAQPAIPWVEMHEAKEADLAAQPAEPLFTGTWLGIVQSSSNRAIEAIIDVDEEPPYTRQNVDVYPAGSRPAPRKVTAVDVAQALQDADFVVADTADATDCRELADALNAILASKAGA